MRRRARTPAHRDPKDPGPFPNTTSMSWHFDPGFYPEFDLVIDTGALPSWSRDYGLSRWGFGFIDTQRYLSNNSNNLTVSAAFWMEGSRYIDMDFHNTYTACLIDARWVESEVWTIPLESALLARHTVSIDNPSYSTSPETPIVLKQEWLNMLNATFMVRGFLGDPDHPSHVFDQLGNPVMGPSQVTCKTLRTDTLCVLITDALTRVHISYGQWAENFDRPHADGLWTMWDQNHNKTITDTTLSELRTSSPGDEYAMMEVAYYHNAYAYEFGTSTVMILSWAVLLTHLLLVLIHVLVMIFHRGWSSGAWVQLGELLALAVKSTPPQDTIMRNTGAGVDRWRTWMLRVSVKEVEDENGAPSGRVELILQEPGVGTDGNHQAGGTTQADRKYG